MKLWLRAVPHPPRTGLWAAWSRSTGASPWVECLVCYLGATIISGVLAFLCLRHFDFQGGTKGSALCGVFSPSTPPWSDLVLLCAAALRYSSLMFQVPLWMFTKACLYPLWSSYAPSPSVCCCLPAPCLLSVLVSLCCVLSCPVLVLPSACFLPPFFCYLWLSVGSSFSFCFCLCRSTCGVALSSAPITF